ncbi:selenide, water dikinase SelD [Actinomadura alba]|uniref:Selenide, water dikinase n=1 Tax=Actinomadura alba TaxID=406431 RepID=A0ABR7M0J7_9ACTN|nr:selenide, water dikinase SelD [Actinomadura alba]MBC6470247.1 selenide, water dikinase SelD [Actinomadura alba]
MSVPAAKAARLTSLSPGAGCACKLPMSKLENLLSSLTPGLQPASGDLLIGALEGDDAAVLRLDDERALVLTTDFFTPIVDDAYDWGRIAAANALSDVYAMGGRPLIAVNLAAWPGSDLPIELLGDVLRGGADVATEAGCPVVGGHTVDDAVPKYGMAVVGMAHPDHLFAIDQIAEGQQLVLTKPIGTGVVATALKNGAADESTIQAAVDCMTLLNAGASELALAAGVRAATDVTGFSLLGHLHRMLRASGVAATVFADRVPLLPGAIDLVDAGFVSGGTRANIERLKDAVTVDGDVTSALSTLLHDAQTSGGLLLSVPQEDTELLAALQRRGLTAAVIGRTAAGPAGAINVRRTAS